MLTQDDVRRAGENDIDHNLMRSVVEGRVPMSIIRTPIIDKNGKDIHVHKRARVSW